MYTLILVATNVFLGQYNSLQSCNNAIRAIYEKQLIPYPQYLTKEQLQTAQRSVDLTVKYQRDYTCVKQ